MWKNHKEVQVYSNRSPSAGQLLPLVFSFILDVTVCYTNYFLSKFCWLLCSLCDVIVCYVSFYRGSKSMNKSNWPNLTCTCANKWQHFPKKTDNRGKMKWLIFSMQCFSIIKLKSEWLTKEIFNSQTTYLFTEHHALPNKAGNPTNVENIHLDVYMHFK